MILRRHIKREKLTKLSSWRKIALSSWRSPKDPQTFGLLKFDATHIGPFLKRYEEQHGVKVSTTHIVGKALGLAFREHPEVNCYVVGNSLFKRENIDIFFHVALDEQGRDLSGLVIPKTDTLSLGSISQIMREKALEMRKGNDKSFNEVKRRVLKTPSFALRSFLSLLDFILYRLNLWSSILGVKSDPFGSAMVTSVSSFGVESGFVPIPAISHVPVILAVFGIKEEVVSENHEVKIKNMLTIGATLDHRVIDGVYGGKIVKSLKKYIENPHLMD